MHVRPSLRRSLLTHFLFNIAFLAGIVAGATARHPFLTVVLALSALTILNLVWLWMLKQHQKESKHNGTHHADR